MLLATKTRLNDVHGCRVKMCDFQNKNEKKNCEKLGSN